MEKARKQIDISQAPELARLAEEVRASQEPTVLSRADEALAVLILVPMVKSRSRTPRPVTEEDALFRLIGIGSSGIAGGVSGKKHEHVARAYRSR